MVRLLDSDHGFYGCRVSESELKQDNRHPRIASGSVTSYRAAIRRWKTSTCARRDALLGGDRGSLL